MQETFIRELLADRIGGREFGVGPTLWKFEKIKLAKRKAILEHPDIPIIDMGVGEPDEMADYSVVDVLCEEAYKSENRYYADNGINEFKESVIDYMSEVFQVKNLKMTEVNHCMGSKSGLSMIAQGFINSGDIILMTVPGYPITGTMTKWLGGTVYKLPLYEENNFFPDLDNIDSLVLEKAKILYINYPNNPTGQVATKEFYERVVEFAKKNKIIVIQDAAYGAITFGDNKPLSFLSVEGAKDVGVEFHSLSKAFNMTGWRMAFIAGNELIVKAFCAVKDNNDAGQFIPIQKASSFALHHHELTQKSIEKYDRRCTLVVNLLRNLGFKVERPKGSFYIYTRIPARIKGGRDFKTAEDFHKYLIEEKQISAVPWDDVGHYIRFSVTFAANTPEEEVKVIQLITDRLSDVEFEF